VIDKMFIVERLSGHRRDVCTVVISNFAEGVSLNTQ
jgi:hypothetical protein